MDKNGEYFGECIKLTNKISSSSIFALNLFKNRQIVYASHFLSMVGKWFGLFCINDPNASSNILIQALSSLSPYRDRFRFRLFPGIGNIITMMSLELSEFEIVLLELWEILFKDTSLLLLLLLLILLFTLVMALKVRIINVKKLKLLKPRLPIPSSCSLEQLEEGLLFCNDVSWLSLDSPTGLPRNFLFLSDCRVNSKCVLSCPSSSERVYSVEY